MTVDELIAKLEDRVRQIQQTIAILKDERGQAPPPTIMGGVKEILADQGKPLSVGQLTKALLDRGFKTRSAKFELSVRSALKQDGQKNSVIRMGRGLWGLQEWLEEGRPMVAAALEMFRGEKLKDG